MYNSLIIGAGAIAGGYDEPGEQCILTHAHGYAENPHINLLGLYDINYENAKKMADKWSTKTFKSLDEVQNADIISICTPDIFHLSSIEKVLMLNPKVIFLEKPIAENFYNAKEIIKISENLPIQVNFSRRFVKEFQQLANDIKHGIYGSYISGTGYYGKGFVHNGSHMLDLLNLLIGKIDKVKTVSSVNDFYENDFTKSVVLDFENGGKFFMQGVDCRNYTIFELELFFEKARIRIVNSGFDIEIYSVKESKKFKGYKNLDLSENIHTELDFAMKNAVSNIVDYLDNKADLLSKPYILPVYEELYND